MMKKDRIEELSSQVGTIIHVKVVGMRRVTSAYADFAVMFEFEDGDTFEVFFDKDGLTVGSWPTK